MFVTYQSSGPNHLILACVFFFFQVASEIKAIKADLKKKKSLLQMDELKCRKRVLRRLGYCTAADVIELKGRVACEISRYESSFVCWEIFNV